MILQKNRNEKNFAGTLHGRVLPRITEMIVQSSRALMTSADNRCKDRSGINTAEEDMRIA